VSSTGLLDALWRKSSHSNGQANCVEAATIGHGTRAVAVRDSKAPASPALIFAPPAWRRFTATVTAGRTAS
jgi:Domain of unknown function (DUF397)